MNDNRTYSSGGGEGLYIKSDHNFHLRDDLRIDIIENVCLTSIYLSLVYPYLIYI